jgi:hypothetical protein
MNKAMKMTQKGLSMMSFQLRSVFASQLPSPGDTDDQFTFGGEIFIY